MILVEAVRVHGDSALPAEVRWTNPRTGGSGYLEVADLVNWLALGGAAQVRQADDTVELQLEPNGRVPLAVISNLPRY
jgi:hypothetical protein